MTSKTSCNNSIPYKKYVLENIKQRSWFMVLSFISLFFVQTVYITINIENFFNGFNGQDLASYQEDFPFLLNGAYARPLAFILALLAIVCAVSGYAYLHQSEKTDFFHGLPLKRSQWFNISYLGGLLMFLIPYLLSSLCTMAIAASKGILVSSNLVPSLLAVLGGLLGCLILYHTAILAMMLTGRLIAGTLAAFVLIVYGSMVTELFSELCSRFYDTLYHTASKDSLPAALSTVLSPLSIYSSSLYRTASNDRLPLFLLAAAIFITGIWALACYLYEKRSLETAGNTLAFPKSASVIKILIAVPTALSFGLFADSFNHSTGNKWVIFCSIFAVILLCGLIEFIYTRDLRQICRRKTASLISIIGTVGILAVMQLDLFGYDTWLPEKTDIKSMALYSDSYLYYLDYADSVVENSEAYYPLFANNAQTTNIDRLYQLAEEGVSNHNAGIHPDDMYQQTSMNDYTGVIIRFNKTNGKSSYRSYMVKCESLTDTLDELCQKESYRRNLFPVFHVTEDQIESVELHDIRSTMPLQLTGEEKAALLKAYQQDVLGVDIHKLQEESPIGSFSFHLKSNKFPPDRSTYTADPIFAMTNLYIFDTYTNTLDLLKKYGYTICTKIQPEDVVQMTYTKPDPKDNDSESGAYPVTDPAKIRQFLDRIKYTAPRIAGGWDPETGYIEVWLKGETSSQHYPVYQEESKNP